MFGLMVFFSPVVSPANANEVIGEVNRINSKIKRPSIALSGQTHRPLDFDSAVLIGDHLQVPAGERLSFRLLDGSQITLGGDSDLVLEEFIYSELNQIGYIELSLLNGSIHLNTGGIRRVENFPVFLATPLADIRAQNANIWLYLADAGLTIGMLGGFELLVETDGGFVTLKRPGDVTHITTRDLPPSTPYQMGGQQMAAIIGSVIDLQVLTALVGPGDELSQADLLNPDAPPNPDSQLQPRTAEQASQPADIPDNKPMMRPDSPQLLVPDAGS